MAKKLLQKALWLYIIAWLTTVSLLWFSDTFAQWNSAGAGFWVNAQNSAGLNWIAGAGSDQWDWLIGLVKSGINYALWFVSLIAFAMLIWWGYKMVASWWDEWAYKEGIKILKNAAIGIAFIAISWFLVTFIFAAIGFVTGSGN
jgi:predicted permease